MDITSLKKRQSFKTLRYEGHAFVCPFFILQATSQEHILECVKENSSPSFFLGITASKKIGHAPWRNFAKRRVRSLCAEFFSKHGKEGYAYHFIVRKPLRHAPYQELSQTLVKALVFIHKKKNSSS